MTYYWKGLALGLLVVFNACTPSSPTSDTTTPSTWQLDTLYQLDSITPIGLALYQGNLWLADGDHNRVVCWSLDQETITQTIGGFERPMHLDADEQQLYIPEYGNDTITQLIPGQPRTHLPIGLELDAPAGISLQQNRIAIADFYNHRILVYDGLQWRSIGEKGQENGQLHYPTDVQWNGDRLYVADAYNHRVQVWTMEDNWLMTIAATDSINAATGLFVHQEELWVTDFEHHRVLGYDLDGNLLHTLDSQINHPTDVLRIDNSLYITNYGNRTLAKFKKT